MKIAFDMMGGDFAPLEAAKGLLMYRNKGGAAHVLCIGDETQLKPLLEEYHLLNDATTIIHAPEVIGYHEPPTRALKEKTKSSIAIGFYMLAGGKADAFASAGNTGAMMVGTMYSIKTIEGILRPSIPTVIPKLTGGTGLLLDVGLNADCKPEQLNQFAVLGSLYMQHIFDIENPRVALLNVGEEEGKGNALAQATHPLMKENSRINFVGNVEGRDILQDKSDVIVCDGFTGNVILKLAESVYDIAVARGIDNDEYFHRFHYENYGGTPVLGVSKPVVIGHGISNDKAFCNMIKTAEKMIQHDLCERMKESFSAE